MHQVTPDEFRVFQGNLAFWLSRLFTLAEKVTVSSVRLSILLFETAIFWV